MSRSSNQQQTSRIQTPALNFRELRRQVFFHDLRVFVYGAEVTPDIRERVSITISDRETPNIATFVLDNALDKYIFTDINARADAGFGVDPYNRYSEVAKQTIVAHKTGILPAATKQGRSIAIQNAVKDVFEQEIRPKIGDQITYRATPEMVDETAGKVVGRLTDEFFHEYTVKPDKPLSDAEQDANQQRTLESQRAIVDEISGLMPGIDQSTLNEFVVRAYRQRGSLGSAQSVLPENLVVPDRRATALNPQDPDTGQYRYQFDAGDCVLHKHDPVIIYARNPFVESKEQWYPAFTGFINTVTQQTNETNGESSMTVSCYCVRAMMRRMRISLNDGLGVIEPQLLLTDPEMGHFRDIIRPGSRGRSHVLQDLALEQAVCKLVTGVISKEVGVTQDTQYAANAQEINTGRVGDFTPGIVIRYPETERGSGDQTAGIPTRSGPDDDTRALEAWHTLSCLGRRGAFMSYEAVTRAGLASVPGGSNDPWRRQIHFLLPRDGTNIRRLHAIAFDSNPTVFTMSNRLDALLYFVKELDYQFITSPNGDLLLEFPMYDFTPDDFGPEWAPFFRYHDHLMSTTVTDEAAEIPTGVQITGSFSGVGNEQEGTAQRILRRAIAFSRTVAARYGLGSIDEESKQNLKEISQIAAYATISYQRKLMDASQMSMTAAFRPFMMPNRPILNERRQRMALTTVVETSWDVFKDVTTDMTFKAVRKRSTAVVGGTTIECWRFVCGGAALSLSYRLPAPQPLTPVEDDGSDSGPEAAVVGLDHDRKSGIATLTEVGNLSDERFIPPVNVGVANGANTTNLSPASKQAIRSMAACIAPTKITITSGRRSETEQTKLRSKTDDASVKSKHITGDAFDVRLRDPSTGRRVLSPGEVKKIADCGNKAGYHCIIHHGTADHMHFQKRSKPAPGLDEVVKGYL